MRIQSVLLPAWFAVLAVSAIAGRASAQATQLTVGIAAPGEGETFYAGPQVYLYTISVSGWVVAPEENPADVQLQLRILQDGRVVCEQPGIPDPDGTFLFKATVNPEAWLPAFRADEKVCANCHYRTALFFPPGRVQLRLTATGPTGTQAIAERNLFVDRGGAAELPVVVEAGDGEAPAGVPVQAAARFYGWRTRYFSAETDAAGRAGLSLEALALQPASYVLSIPPVVVDGVYYSSPESLNVTVLPGADRLTPVTLLAHASRGEIVGRVNESSDASSTALAVELTTGAAHRAPVTGGSFTFTDLPVTKYLLTTETEGWLTPPQSLDLTSAPRAEVALTTTPSVSRNGIVRAPDGSPLPFAWATVEGTGLTSAALPTSGEFALLGLPEGARALSVSAPGYWSQIAPLAGEETLDVTLTPRPETKTVPWGAGAITLPAGTNAALADGRINFTRGWLWGRGQGEFSIETQQGIVTVSDGAFALEALPGRSSWLYLMEGAASLTPTGGESLALGAGEMVAFGKGVSAPLPVPLDPSALRALRFGVGSPLEFQSEPTASARLRDGLARLGIGAAQAVALFTYAAAVLAVIGVPLLLLRRLLRKKAGSSGIGGV